MNDSDDGLKYTIAEALSEKRDSSPTSGQVWEWVAEGDVEPWHGKAKGIEG